MTEDEAKTKWCPAFRGNDHGVNRPLDLDTNALMGRCIASACMAWRWDYPHVQTNKPEEREGHCGLAGA
jgi:hypothetical protein